MYPTGFSTWVEVTDPLAERLEGTSRLGHFRLERIEGPARVLVAARVGVARLIDDLLIG